MEEIKVATYDKQNWTTKEFMLNTFGSAATDVLDLKEEPTEVVMIEFGGEKE